MSLLEEYKKLKEIRLADGEKSKKHYLSVNLPGVRKISTGEDADAVRKRIQEMAKLKSLPNHD